MPDSMLLKSSRTEERVSGLPEAPGPASDEARTPAAGAPGPAQPRRGRAGWKWALAAGIVAAGIWLGAPAYRQWQASRVFPAGLIQVNGRIEGDRYTLSGKYGGRITDLEVAEGDPVTRGQVLVRLDDIQAREQLRQAEAALQALMAEGSGAGETVALTEETGGAQVQQAQGVLAQADSAESGARAEVTRAAAALETARAEVRTAEARIETARAGETAAAANRDTGEEEIRGAEAARDAAAAARRRAQEALATARAQVEGAKASVTALQDGVAGAQAAYEKARTDARRYRMLFNEGAASAATRDAYNTAEKTALAQLNTAKAQVTVAEREVQSREAAAAAAKEQIAEADAELAARTAAINAKRKQLAGAEAQASGARSETETARRQLSVAQTGVRQAEAQLRGAREQVRQMEARRAQALAGLRQARTAPRQVAVRKADRAQSEARIRQGRARVRELRSLLADNVIRAPVSGTVTTRLQDRGEVVAAGTPLLELVNLDALYLKVYVPEDQIGKLRVGLPARVYTDAFPLEPFPATVRAISPRAEFTPKEVQTKAERVKLVYAVKLYLDANPDHRLTPGLPADAVIRWEPGTPWKAPRW